MRYTFRTATIFVVGILVATNGQAQQTDDWPDWLKEAMAIESGTLKTVQVEIETGPYRFTLPEETTGPTAFDGGWYFESQIGSASVMECYVFTSDPDLATLVNNLAEINIEATAEANGGNVDNRSVFALDAGHLEGVPYLAIEWFYTVGEAPNALAGFTKIRAATHGDITLACTHNTTGYRESFKKIFDEFIVSMQQPTPEVAPYYEEVSVQKFGDQPIGIALMTYTLDEDGDTRIEIMDSSIIPVSSDTVTSSDTVDISWSTPSGMLINTVTAISENGELVTDLSLARGDDNDWVVSGTFQGKELEQIIDGSNAPISELGSMQIARDLFAGNTTTTTFPMWLGEVDPTQIIESTITRDDAENEGQAVLTLGPISMLAKFDANGSISYGSVQMGATEFILERVWHRGSIH